MRFATIAWPTHTMTHRGDWTQKKNFKNYYIILFIYYIYLLLFAIIVITWLSLFYSVSSIQRCLFLLSLIILFFPYAFISKLILIKIWVNGCVCVYVFVTQENCIKIDDNWRWMSELLLIRVLFLELIYFYCCANIF